MDQLRASTRVVKLSAAAGYESHLSTDVAARYFTALRDAVDYTGNDMRRRSGRDFVPFIQLIDDAYERAGNRW